MGLLLFLGVLQFMVLAVQSDCEIEIECEKIDYYFYRKDMQSGTKISNLTESLDEIPYDSKLKLILIIHGYTGHKDYSPNMELRPAYFKEGDYNIISVDFSEYVKYPCYPNSVFALSAISNCISQFLIEFHISRSVSLLSNHVIGFSLGAHVAGLVGRDYFNDTGLRLPRITALDPAGPLFYIVGRNMRLKEDDAQFIDVYHSNAGLKGYYYNLGHVDLYLNGGNLQPSCGNNYSCSHVKAVEVFAESINKSNKLEGLPCAFGEIFGYNWYCLPSNGTTKIKVGEYISVNSTGTYYVETQENHTNRQYGANKLLSDNKI